MLRFFIFSDEIHKSNKTEPKISNKRDIFVSIMRHHPSLKRRSRKSGGVPHLLKLDLALKARSSFKMDQIEHFYLECMKIRTLRICASAEIVMFTYENEHWILKSETQRCI